MIYLSHSDIIKINLSFDFNIIWNSSTNTKILNHNSLEYLVRIVQESINGEQLYPSLFDIAAAYSYYIIEDHIFIDGNKRTGMMSALTFLRLNEVDINYNLTDETIENTALDIAQGKHTLNSLSELYSQLFQVE